MGQAVEVTCPTCKKIFVVNPHMLGSGMNFHCPFCNLYFPENDSQKFASNRGTSRNASRLEVGTRRQNGLSKVGLMRKI